MDDPRIAYLMNNMAGPNAAAMDKARQMAAQLMGAPSMAPPGTPPPQASAQQAFGQAFAPTPSPAQSMGQAFAAAPAAPQSIDDFQARGVGQWFKAHGANPANDLFNIEGVKPKRSKSDDLDRAFAKWASQ